MSALRNYQQEVEPFILYSVVADPRGNGSSIQPYIQVIGDPVTVYTSINEPSNPFTQMINVTPNRLSGISKFNIVPNYIYFTNEDEAESTILLSGIKATRVTANNPNIIPGLVEWLQQNSYILSGSLVDEWVDSTRFSNAATSAGTLRPSTGIKLINNLSVVTFNGTDLMDLATNLYTLPSENFTMFFVINPTSTASSFILGSTTGGSDNRFSVGISNDFEFPIVTFRCGDVADSPVSQVVDYLNNLLVICVKKEGSTLSLSVNNAPFVVNLNGASVNNINRLTLGVDVDSFNFYTGDMCEILFYDGAISFAECTTIINYLSTKWNTPEVPAPNAFLNENDIVSNGGIVESWGNPDYGVVATSLPDAPATGVETINGLATVTFTPPTQQTMDLGQSNRNAGDCTFFIVIKAKSLLDRASIIDTTDSDSGNSVLLSIDEFNNPYVAYFHNSAIVESDILRFFINYVNTPIIICVQRQGTLQRIQVNGSDFISNNRATDGLPTQFLIGDGALTGDQLNADIGTILIFDRFLSDAERTNFNQQLSLTYNIPLI